jgi:hypothetical protein
LGCFADQPKPFDFLVDGDLIRQSLAKFLLSKKISAVCFPLDPMLLSLFEEMAI